MGNIFYRIFKYLENRKKIYFLLALSLFGWLFWMSSNLKFDEDISKLIPSNSENNNLQNVLKTVNFSDKIIVNISLEKDGEFADLIDYASNFTDTISMHYGKYVKDIKGRIEDEDALETIDFVYDNLPLFLSSNDYNKIDLKINKDSIKEITKTNYKTLTSPSGFIAKSTIVKDPLGISFMGLKQLSQLGLADDFKLKDGFLVSKDEKHILLFINPSFKTSNTHKSQLFSDKLYGFQKNLNAHYHPKVKGNYFGGPLIAVANAKQIKTDIQITISIALSALVLLFILFYRKLTIPIILFIPTVFGGLLGMTILSFIRTEISAISLGIGAVLLGVTLDYSLHLLTHIRNQETVDKIYNTVTKPILMSSITTALAFLCLLFINSQALQDLGIFAAISVIGASVFALIFIPQIYTSKDGNTLKKKTVIDAFANHNFENNKVLIGVILMLFILSIFTFSTVKFNKDLSQLNYIPSELREAELKIDALTNVSSKSLYIIAYGEDMQTVLQTNDSIFKVISELKKQQKILDFNSIGAFATSKKNQKERIDNWHSFWPREKVTQLKQNLIESSISLGFKSTSFNEFYELLEKDFKALNIEDFSRLSSIPVSDFITSKDSFKTASSFVKVDNHHIEFIKNTFKDSENILIIDRQNINESLLGNLKNDFNNLILYSLVIILVMLLLFYKNIRLTLVTILPILMTWFLTLGLMGLFNLEFNIFNIIISTFIFGLGVDYSIFMTNGLQQQNEHKTNTIATYKTSVILSVITTVLGVGVLVFAKHPALHSLALVSIIGIISALFIAFTIQPFLYKFFITKSIKKDH